MFSRIASFMLVSCLLVIVTMASPAFADTSPFHPKPWEIENLGHSYYYLSEDSWNVPSGESITGAALSFNFINDWVVEASDIVYPQLLDNPDSVTQVSGGIECHYNNVTTNSVPTPTTMLLLGSGLLGLAGLRKKPKK